jgi:hypothetical protein
MCIHIADQRLLQRQYPTAYEAARKKGYVELAKASSEPLLFGSPGVGCAMLVDWDDLACVFHDGMLRAVVSYLASVRYEVTR